MYQWLYSVVLKKTASRLSVILFPVTMVLGFIGYKLESILSDRHTPTLKSIKERREERLLNEDKEADSLKNHKFVPKTIFERNLSPSLQEPDVKT